MRLTAVLGMCLIVISSVTGCVTVPASSPVVVNGAVGYTDKVLLPQGSIITIAIIDVNQPGKILAQKRFDIVSVPVPFKFMLPRDAIDKKTEYAVVAMIESEQRLIFQTYDKVAVINNGVFTAAVLMQPVFNR